MRDDQQLRVPPHSIESEQSVLGGLMLDNDALDRIVELKAEHFYRHDHRQIFEVIAKMVGAGVPADVVTVYEALRSDPQHVNVLVYLNQLAQNTPSAANIRRYAEIVRDRALKRSLIFIADRIAENAFDGKDEAEALLDQAGSAFEQLGEVRGAIEPVRAGADMSQHLEIIDARGTGLIRAIPTGFGDVDRRLNGGIRRGQLVVVAARPKMGKTAFALGIARHAAIDHTALVLSMEMPRTELHDRNISALGQVSLTSILSPHGLDDADWPRVVHAAGQIGQLRLFLDDQSALRLIDVRSKARLVKRRHGLDLIVIDYLQLMEGQGDNRNAQIEQITRGLKGLAKELDVGIVLLSQLNRKLEDRPDKRPTPGDLRDSGSIEQDADVVIFLYRDEVYHADSQDHGLCEVNVCLNRSGEPGRERLTFLGHQVRFESHAGPWQAPLGMSPRRARPAKQFEDA